MLRTSSWCATSLLVAAALPAATVLEKRIVHDLRADGTVLETTSLRVRIDTPADMEKWSPYYVFLDDNRQLVKINTYALRPDGERLAVRSRQHDRRAVRSANVLHGSATAQEVPFPAAPVGTVLAIDYQVAVAPYYPGGVVALAERDEVAELVVRLRGRPPGWRWHLAGAAAGLSVTEEDGTLLVQGGSLAAKEDLDEPPELLYAWGADDGWAGVGGWYDEILADLPPPTAALGAHAARLAGEAPTPREKLEALLAFLRREVRYVAVEVGIGGYRPTPSGETLERRWGDCKDKSLLLIDLLASVGIEAHPALIRASLVDGIDPAFATPFVFNHLIVAVPSAAVEIDEGVDPVAAGFLFVDPTQERGTAGWLHPAVQGQHALVVRGAESVLAETPYRAGSEGRRVLVELTIDGAGDARGRAEIVLTGRFAAGFRDLMATPQAGEAARYAFADLLPGVAVGDDLRWGYDETSLPTLTLAGSARLSALVQGLPGTPSMRLPGIAATPSPRQLRDEEGDDVGAVTQTARFRLRLPATWCPPATSESETSTAAGRFAQRIAVDGGALLVERRVDVLPGAAGDELVELATAEHRAHRRRLRFACPANLE